MKKRASVRIISFTLAAFLTLSGFLISEKRISDQNKLQLENGYVKSLNTLETSLNNITENLNKASYIGKGSDLLSLSTSLFCEGEIAKNALAGLPNGNKNSSTLYKFLSQVGNYAVTVSKNSAQGKISEEENKKITQLYKTSKTISKVVEDVNKSYDNIEDFTKIMEDNIKEKIDVNTLAASLDGLEESLNDYPTLIYDGPFSDHILKKEPIMTANAAKYSKSSALKKAENFFGLNNRLNYSGEQKGKLKCYRFEGDNISCCVTENGGYIAYMRNSREIGQSRFSAEEAIQTAENFLMKNGIKNMKETYYYAVDGECTVNFAYMSDDTLCYTDLIKVGVALDTGEIVFYEAYGYLTNHTTRSFDKANHTLEEARKELNKELKVISNKICLIPADSGSEIRCYEFLCETQEKGKIFVYISVKNLDTVKVLLVEESTAGILVK